MFDYDYCFCGNADKCSKKDTCKRALRISGIHSYSNFYFKNEEYKYYYPIKKEEQEV